MTTPVFSVDGISACVGVKERVAVFPYPERTLLPWGPNAARDNFRFVSDERTGTLLTIYMNHRQGFVYVENFTLKSVCQRQRMTLVFHLGPLFKILEAASGTLDFKAEDVHEALAMVQVIDEFRECQKCGSALPTCSCSLSLSRASNPMDFSTVQNNLELHCGNFQGFQAFYQFTAAAETANAALGSKFFLEFTKDVDSMVRLKDWSISECIAGAKPWALNFAMPKAGESNAEVEEDLFGYFGDLEGIELLNGGDCGGDDVGNMAVILDEMKRKSKSKGSESGRAGEGSTKKEKLMVKASNEELESPKGVADLGTVVKEEEEKGNGSDKKMSEKMAKMQVRREKNRLAAKRSNLCKKLKNEELRRELKVWKKWQIELREKEGKLRLENSDLRRRVAQGEKEGGDDVDV